MSGEFIPPAKPFFPESDIDEMKTHLDRILRSGNLTLGEYTKNFESRFAEIVGVKHAVALNSGTAALEIALRTQGLKQGDEIIVPTNTFGATATAVIFAGGRPVITDISPLGLALDSTSVKLAITRRTRGVMAVHIGGLVCPDIEPVAELCDTRGLFLIEDAAHAHGSSIKGRQAGSFGLAGCFSFYPTKLITSSEGGMITTDDDRIAETARILRDQGKESYNSNRIVKLGYNWRMPEVCAAQGIVQLKRLPDFIERRNAIAKIYDAKFDELEIEHLMTPKGHVNNYYKYTAFLPKRANRDKFKELCRNERVNYGGEVYWPPLHMQPAFRQFVMKNAKFRVADEFCRRMVNPPMFSQMTPEQAQLVGQVTQKALSQLAG